MPFLDAPVGLRTLTARVLNWRYREATGQSAGDHETLRAWLQGMSDAEIFDLRGIGKRRRPEVLRWVRGAP